MKTRSLAAATAILLIAGCASIAVTDDAIVQRTAFALNLDKSAFTVSDRKDDGARTQYVVTTRNGLRYNCYVGGGISVLGRSVSDAICQQVGGPPAASPAAGSAGAAPAGSCNALLKAAGKC